jgi:hypothetical protein
MCRMLGYGKMNVYLVNVTKITRQLSDGGLFKRLRCENSWCVVGYWLSGIGCSSVCRRADQILDSLANRLIDKLAN